MCCVKDTFQRRNLADWSIGDRRTHKGPEGVRAFVVMRVAALLEEFPKQVIHYGAVAVIIEHIG